jgi:calcium-translocating P-type ATPase
MLGEILFENQIFLLEEETLQDALSEIQKRSPNFEKKDTLFNEFLQSISNPYNYINDMILVPHVRIQKMKEIKAYLGVFPKGILVGENRIHLLLLLATPKEKPSIHLKVLQGLSSLLPSIQNELLQCKSPKEVLEKFVLGESSINLSFKNMTQKQVEFELQTKADAGLSSEQAEERLKYYGKNEIEKVVRIPWYIKLFKNFFSFFAILLWIAAILCYIPGVDMPELGTAVFLVVFVNGLFSFLQEYKSDRAVDALRKMMAQQCRVIRNGTIMEINADTIVPGDLISLEEGDVVPADARIVEAYEVEVDNSSLTGESTSAKRYKSDQEVLVHGKFLWIELPNILFAGSSLIKGNAKAIVFGTGMNSEIGKIAGLTQGIKAEESPLQKELKRTVIAISLLAFGIGLTFLFLGWFFAGLTFVQAFIFFIGIFVANVPEGLLPTVTLALAMGVSRMAKRNAIVKNLSSVETLGCTTVICSDKTGTLTQNLMMVTEVYTDFERIQVKGLGYDPVGELWRSEQKLSREDISKFTSLKELLTCAYNCNNARLESNGTNTKVIGDPTEGALLTLAKRAGFQGTAHRIFLNPFESIRKRMSAVIHDGNTNKNLVYVKGAPIEVLELCISIHTKDGIVSMTEELRERIKKENDLMAKRGLRVLAFAMKETSLYESDYSVESAEKDLIFLGLAALSDPIRPSVPAAIEACHTAGVRVMMVTGDYALTAESIGRQIGLGSNGNLKVTTGTDITFMKDEELVEYLRNGECIFARVSPEQKLRIVTILQSLGEVVAVTGDGVNDGPALKKADIGIAMGLRGTDVAKEAAEIILTDDNFASIVSAIEEGRAIFENIKKFSAYIFNSNPQELIPFILWMLIPGFPLVMTVMGVLAVDVGTDLIPAMGLGIEPPEKGIMEKPPRKKTDKLLSIQFILRSYFVQGSILALSCFTTYYYFVYTSGFMKDGFSFFSLPGSPLKLDMNLASNFYLQSLTAFFFPTVATQIANVMCKRSSKTSLFSKDFLQNTVRHEILQKIHSWKTPHYAYSIQIQYTISSINRSETIRVLFVLLREIILFPFKLILLTASNFAKPLDAFIIHPVRSILARLLERFPFLLNLFSNPLITIGILFELGLSYAFFYTDLKHLYYFEPVPWHVYIFAFHGTVLLLVFEETKKYFRRKGHALDWLG